MADWRRVLAHELVREGQITTACVDDLRLILLRDGEDVFAYRDECPHEQHPLSKGELEDGVLICAKHLWEFELRTGQHITRVPRVERNLVRFPTRVANGEVEVDVASPERFGSARPVNSDEARWKEPVLPNDRAS